MNSRNGSLNSDEGSAFEQVQDFNNPGNPFLKPVLQNNSSTNNTNIDEDEIYFNSKNIKNAINDTPSLINFNKDFMNKNEYKILQIDKEQMHFNIKSQKPEKSKEEKNSQKINKNSKLFIDINYFDITNFKTQKIEEENITINESVINQNNKNSGKFRYFNIMKRIRTFVLNLLKDFINQKLIKIYKNIGNGINIKKLIVNEKTKEKDNIEYYRKFMNKTIGEIFSCEISKKYTNFDENKNKTLIEELINEKDLNKKIYFEKLFNLSFLDCLEHIMEQKNIDVLKGIKPFSEFKNNPSELRKIKLDPNDGDYLATFEDILKNYVNHLYKRNPRKRTTNKVIKKKMVRKNH